LDGDVFSIGRGDAVEDDNVCVVVNDSNVTYCFDEDKNIGEDAVDDNSCNVVTVVGDDEKGISGRVGEGVCGDGFGGLI